MGFYCAGLTFWRLLGRVPCKGLLVFIRFIYRFTLGVFLLLLYLSFFFWFLRRLTRARSHGQFRSVLVRTGKGYFSHVFGVVVATSGRCLYLQRFLPRGPTR